MGEKTDVVSDEIYVEDMFSSLVVDNDVTSDKVEVYSEPTIPTIPTPIIRRSYSYIVTDSGAEIITHGSDWRIPQKEEIPCISIGGPSTKMGSIHMHRGTGITKVKSINLGWVILRAANNALIYPEELRDKEKETLFCLSQLMDFNIQEDDCPQKYGRVQCLFIQDQGEQEVSIPLYYNKDISRIDCEEPTDEEMNSLPTFDVIDPEGKWNIKTLPPEEFNLQLCNQAISLRKQRRAKIYPWPQ